LFENTGSGASRSEILCGAALPEELLSRKTAFSKNKHASILCFNDFQPKWL